MNNMMVEVFKTNVENPDHARLLVEQIQATFGDYCANFDLEDCDRILRVVSANGYIQTSGLMTLLNRFGFQAEVLSDDIPEVFTFK